MFRKVLMCGRCLRATGIFLALMVPCTVSCAEMTSMPVAVFSGLDKVTARVSRLRVPVGETIRFGDLRITVRACRVGPPASREESMAFLFVDAIGHNDSAKKIFSGWMFASSPGLHAIEHPVFDIWLTGCEKDPAFGKEDRMN